MQIVVGPAIKRLVTIELTGRMLVILSHVTSELFPQAFLSQIVDKDIESSICLGQNLIFSFMSIVMIGFRTKAEVEVRHDNNVHHVIHAVGSSIPIAWTNIT